MNMSRVIAALRALKEDENGAPVNVKPGRKRMMNKKVKDREPGKIPLDTILTFLVLMDEGGDKLTQVDLQRIVGMSESAASRHVKNLCERAGALDRGAVRLGWIVKERRPDNQRLNDHLLTVRGERVLKAFKAALNG